MDDLSPEPPAEDSTETEFSDETPPKTNTGEGSSWAFRAFYLCGGMAMSLGLYVSTMVLPQVIWGFMTLQGFWQDPFSWNPSLLIVFVLALVSHFVLYQTLMKFRTKPLMAQKFDIPCNTTINVRLVLGAFLFGCGWGGSGLCPGPAIVACGRLDWTAAVYLSCVMLSSYCLMVFEVWKNNEEDQKLYPPPSLLFFALFLFVIWIPQILVLVDATPDWPDDHDWEEYWYLPVIGGLVIGTSIFLFMLFIGKIAGNSGMLKGTLKPTNTNPIHDRVNKFLWFVGMVVTGFWMNWALPLPETYCRPVWLYVICGILTGLGTTLGNGCTSGHGICGMSRFSIRSLVATGVFFITCIGAASSLRAITEDDWQWDENSKSTAC